VQEFAAAFTSGKRQGYIELVFSRLCGILLFQDMRSLYGRRVPFVPGSRCGGLERPPPSGDRWLRLRNRIGWCQARFGVPRWRQAGSLSHALGCRDGDRLEAYPTLWGAAMATGWKPIPRFGVPRWRQAGSLSHALGCCDGDRLEAYPTVGVRRYLDCKICELTEDLSLAMDVIP
jgi:hypothetical protein